MLGSDAPAAERGATLSVTRGDRDRASLSDHHGANLELTRTVTVTRRRPPAGGRRTRVTVTVTVTAGPGVPDS